MRRSVWLMLRAALPLLGPIWISGCVPAGDCSVLPLRAYSPAFNAALAAEVEAAPDAAVWPRAVQDYAGLRDAVRACQGSR